MPNGEMTIDEYYQMGWGDLDLIPKPQKDVKEWSHNELLNFAAFHGNEGALRQLETQARAGDAYSQLGCGLYGLLTGDVKTSKKYIADMMFNPTADQAEIVKMAEEFAYDIRELKISGISSDKGPMLSQDKYDKANLGKQLPKLWSYNEEELLADVKIDPQKKVQDYTPEELLTSALYQQNKDALKQLETQALAGDPIAQLACAEYGAATGDKE